MVKSISQHRVGFDGRYGGRFGEREFNAQLGARFNGDGGNRGIQAWAVQIRIRQVEGGSDARNPHRSCHRLDRVRADAAQGSKESR